MAALAIRHSLGELLFGARLLTNSPTRMLLLPFAMVATAQQIAGLQAAMVGRNETCAYNQTLDQILAL
mgnify:CR=1 FL=1|jgi:hypothetical protein